MDVYDPAIGGTIRLRDGRRLGFAEFGDPAGKPLFFFHGGGSSRLTRHPNDSIVEELGIRLITTDRPGIGLSDFQPDRRLLDWPDDVCQLADALRIERFAVLGWSAGGPHALACAYKISHRLQAAGVISGLAPLHWPGAVAAFSALSPRLSPLRRRLAESVNRAGRWMPRRARGVESAVAATGLSSREPAHLLPSLPLEVKAIHRERFRDLVRARDWARGMELAMLTCPWGFRLEDIAMEVHLWYGSRDPTTPLFMAEYLQRAIPRARLKVWPGEGHHVGFTHWREVVQVLIPS